MVNPATKRFKRELTVSLQTTDFATAKRKDVREAVRVLDLLALRSGTCAVICPSRSL